ncbi:MAG: phosphoglycolate phosphatase [Rhizobiaceae bacterium]
MPHAPRLMLFDLDGTLVDSNRDLIPALNRATESEGVPPISMQDVGHVVGQGALKMIERAFAFNDHPLETGGETHRRVFKLFLRHYEQNVADQTIFFPGTLAALDGLSAEGWQLAVCTNKYEKLARKLLVELGEAHRFPVITGGDTFDIKKPDPGHLVETARLAGFDAGNCIMVGDSINDIAAAKAAGIPVIAVDFGYTDVPVTELDPDRVISHFNELGAAVKDLTAAAHWGA